MDFGPGAHLRRKDKSLEIFSGGTCVCARACKHSCGACGSASSVSAENYLPISALRIIHQGGPWPITLTVGELLDLTLINIY